MVSVPPVLESMPGGHVERGEADPLEASPILERGGRSIEVAVDPAMTEQRVESILKRRQRDRFAPHDVLAQRPGPEPADPQMLLQERVDRIGRPVLGLGIVHHAVAAGDHQVVFIGDDQDFLGLWKAEINLRQEAEPTPAESRPRWRAAGLGPARP